MGQIKEVAHALREGIEVLGQATGPLETGRANAETLKAEIEAQRAALGGMMVFFRGLSNRVKTDIENPYRTAQRHCEDGTKTIQDALYNETMSKTAGDAWLSTGEVSDRAATLLQQTAVLKGEGWSGIDQVLAALDTARAFMGEMVILASQAELSGDVIQNDLCPPAVERTQNYINTL